MCEVGASGLFRKSQGVDGALGNRTGMVYTCL